MKSPNAGPSRRASRPLSSSPIPYRREPPPVLATPVKGPLNLVKTQFITEQFRSPDNIPDDNWDDDFASAIPPGALQLQLPHLRPHDNFGGLLSSEKLKAYASFQSVAEETSLESGFDSDLTARRPLSPPESDSLQTIRPYYPKRTDMDRVKPNAGLRFQEENRSPAASRQSGAPSGIYQKKPSAKQHPAVNTNNSSSDRNNDDFSYTVTSKNGSIDSRSIKLKVRCL